MALCIVCGRLANGNRGLCRTHYQYNHRKVKRGETTWNKLEKAGKALKVADNRNWGYKGMK